jgi:hypothetical protein
VTQAFREKYLLWGGEQDGNLSELRDLVRTLVAVAKAPQDAQVTPARQPGPQPPLDAMLRELMQAEPAPATLPAAPRTPFVVRPVCIVCAFATPLPHPF